MPSRTYLRFHTESESVIGSVVATAEEVAASLAEIFDSLLETGEQPLDWVLLQKLAGRRLALRAQRLGEVDERLELARTGEKELRRDRDRVAGQLRGELRSVRLLLDENLGREVATGLFRWRYLSQVNAANLVPVARETAAALRASTVLASASLAASGAFAPPGEIADALDRRAGELARLLEILRPSRQRQTFDVGEKSHEWQEASSARLRSQDLLFGIYRAADKEHLARRLRPKPRASFRAAEVPSAAVDRATSTSMANR